ncbi:GntR family transcriptional regulator [Sphingosinicella microcystinivorans]|uniref:GntR family transcriptional regulator n=1 Tax=Sphingosinicella microcystinivorans TaxID=335406 RepID=UPI0022F3B159|nr:GntR family transcriptional regulator [Sphingosinicella microcystinivorans]WBX83744.1 GntR family transcriptional regulator [Sphingosinicella microcystinivorans]
MAPDRHLHENIYVSLKSLLLSHRYRPGQPIDVKALADQFRASVTPVRDGLCRLVGEEIVEMRPSGGFQLWLPSADSLRDLYFWNGQHLLAALHATPPSSIRALLLSVQRSRIEAAADADLQVAGFFQKIADAAANREFSRKADAANTRLYHVRQAESLLIPDASAEAGRIMRPGGADVQKALRRKIHLYHRRRILLAPQIVKKLKLHADT